MRSHGLVRVFTFSCLALLTVGAPVGRPQTPLRQSGEPPLAVPPPPRAGNFELDSGPDPVGPSIEQLLADLEKVQTQKAELAKQEEDLKAKLEELRRRQDERLKRLGVPADRGETGKGREFEFEDADPARIRIPRTTGGPEAARQRFLAIVGESEAGRKLFADLVEDEQRAEAVERAAADPAEARRLYAAQVRRLQHAGEQAYDRHAGRLADAHVWAAYREDCRRAVPPRDLTAALFLGAAADLPAGDDPGEVNHALRATFIDRSAAADKAEFRRLFAAWLDRRQNPEAVRAGLDAALYAYVPDAVGTARRVATDPRMPAAAVGSALLVLGHFGGREDLAVLSDHRYDTRWAEEFVGVDHGEYGVQVRDLAAAMSLRLRAGGPGGPGLSTRRWVGQWFGPDRPPFETLHKMMPEERATAHAHAWAWLDRQPDAPPAPKTYKRPPAPMDRD